MADFVFSRLEATKAVFKEGELVTVNYTVNCRGWPWEIISGQIKVFDDDTGLPVQRFGRDVVYSIPNVSGGQSYALDGASVAEMPNKNWRLRFELTP